MTSKREANREDLRNRLIDAAESQIAANGLRGLKAREVTAEAGCALGALYNAVEDLDQLVMLVNSRTLVSLGDALRDATPDGAGPAEIMQALGQAYAEFAVNNPRLWSALFFHRLPEGVEIPEWHTKEHAALIEQLVAPVSQLLPDLSPEALRLRAGTLFSAVHGVVQLSLHGRFVGTPPNVLVSEVRALIETLGRGLQVP